jgi:hypothetical protein
MYIQQECRPFQECVAGARRLLCIVAVGALLWLGGCSTTPAQITEPHWVTVYDCGERTVTDDGNFTADTNYAKWDRRIGDRASVELEVSLPRSETREGFALSGLSELRFGFAIFVLRFNYNDHHDYWIGREFHSTVIAEVRVDEQSLRMWGPSVVADWHKITKMLQARGDMQLSLYDTSGHVLVREILTRDELQKVENKLRALHARVMEKYSQKETACPSKVMEELPEVPVTG